MLNMPFQERSYWLSTGDYVPNPPLKGPLEVDVAVVGGGFTGLATTHFLKQEAPGLKVALLESQVIGFGASGRNGGFSMTLFGLTLSLTALRFGREKAREAHHYMERSVDMLRALIATHGIDCDYEHPGFLRVATSKKYRERILREIDLARSLGIQGIRWLDRDAVRSEVASPRYLGAWWEPRCGLLNPAKLAWGWKGVIEKQGAAVFEQTPVTEIKKQGRKFRLTVPWGEVTAEKIVLATNAYSHLNPLLKRRQVPVWPHIVLTEPLREDQLREIGWKARQGIEDARNLVHYYRLTSDNRLLMGGRNVSLSFGKGMDHDWNDTTFMGLENDVRWLFPVLREVPFSHRWGGPVSIPTDMAPQMGYLGDKNVVYSLGCVGHGVSMTHLNGKTAADLVLGRKSDLTDVFFVNRKALPWPPEPLRYLLAHLVRGYLNWEDRRTDPDICDSV